MPDTTDRRPAAWRTHGATTAHDSDGVRSDLAEARRKAARRAAQEYDEVLRRCIAEQIRAGTPHARRLR